MKIELGWQTPDEVWKVQSKQSRRGLAILALRISLLSYAAGFGTWYAATLWFPYPLPRVWFTIVPWMIVVMGGYWWLAVLVTFKPRVVRHITRWGINDLRWNQIKAFDVKPLAELPDYEQLILYLGQGRTTRRTLPAEHRRREAVINLVCRKLSWIEGHEKEEDLRNRPPALPRWYTLTCLAGACVWAVGVAWLLDLAYGPKKISGETAQNWLFLSAIVQPAAWLGVGVLKIPRFKRTGDTRLGVWAMCSLIVWIGGIIALTVIRWP